MSLTRPLSVTDAEIFVRGIVLALLATIKPKEIPVEEHDHAPFVDIEIDRITYAIRKVIVEQEKRIQVAHQNRPNTHCPRCGSSMHEDCL